MYIVIVADFSGNQYFGTQLGLAKIDTKFWLTISSQDWKFKVALIVNHSPSALYSCCNFHGNTLELC